jgi:rsbT co-antagonist protein RsbR
MAEDPTDTTADGHRESNADLLTELVAHLRNNRTQLRQEWARRIGEARLLTALTQEEIFSEATSVYDNYVEVLETGSVEALQDYARNLSERIIPRGVETDEVLGIVLLLRDVLARSLFEKYQDDFNRVLDVYEPAANRIANTVAINFVQERERVIRQQQEAIRELSTPVLQVRERLLILPIIGVLDGQRARQLTEQLLRAIRANRARVVVIDITGVPTIDSTVANHLVQTVDASRLMGANVIITGLSPEIAQTLVTLGVELGKVNAVGDLQGGIEEAERLLGYQVSLETPALDAAVLQLQDDVMTQVTRHRSRGIIVDVTALDVMDSFVSRSLQGIARMTRLRGAETVIVGIQPEVAFAMVQLGMAFEDVLTALDLEEGLALLLRPRKEAGDGGG